MLRRYTFKMHPNAAQTAALFETRYLVCQLYNGMVQQRRDAWERCKKSLGKFDQNREMTLLRHDDDRYKALGSGMMERCAERVDQAFKRYFDNVKSWRRGQWSKPYPPSPPRYQKTVEFSGFGCREDRKGWSYENDRVRIKSIPSMVRISGRFPAKPDAIRTCDVMWKNENWWISIVVKLPENAAMSVATGHLLDEQPSKLHPKLNSCDNICCGDHDFRVGTQVIRWRRATAPGSNDPCFGGDAQVQLEDADIQLNLVTHFGSITDKSGTRRIDIEAAKAARGPRGAKNRQRRQAKAISYRDHRMHEVTTEIANRYRNVSITRPKLRAVTASAAGDVTEHGAMVGWKAKFNRDVLDYGAGKFCEMLTYKLKERGGTIEIKEIDDHTAAVPNAIVGLAKVAKKVARVKKRVKRGAISVPTRRNNSAKASKLPTFSRGCEGISA
jgi:transposase